MAEALPDTLLGRRDRALLLLGFAGAFRRSELVSLDVAGVEMTAEGIVVTLRRSKTDQEGQHRRTASTTASRFLATAFLAKPFQFAELLAIARQHCPS